MIDIHCHILPGVDDGSKTLAESMAMAKEAAKQGVSRIVATPHHNNGQYENNGQDIFEAVHQLNAQLKDEGIPVEVFPGQEPRASGDMLADLESGDVVALNCNSGYVLIGFPSSHVPAYTTQLLFDMQIAGYKPIVVQPERNQELMENPDKLYRLVKNGALTQVTAGNLIGKAGKKIERFANQMVEANLAHFMASNAHSVKKRVFYMREALNYLKKNYGETLANQFTENSELLLLGQTIIQEPPERIRPKKKWLIFG
ncbi:tyrosine-protein phosphatase [Lentibacillus sp.]|uniref:tyrosine-protein phosphatase n=1 Tax=Lentibacillus sp. TaxID=1925746 RepID=UPI002B4B151C|nr:CpsB/CapC family capsule biosynthesis tyrosine phosphatase [Lentibacillus sp.]HLS10216.1 CpsB/CapC family capsule biosynthesis tyrosine phosphatase [Lentibacillus sp.]